MVSVPVYLRIVRASALFDLLITAPFATPWTAAWMHQTLNTLAMSFGVQGLPAFAPAHMLMVNLMGSLVCVWSVLRWRRASVELGRYDAVARALFSLWEGTALLTGASLLVAPFLVAEIGFGLAQALPVRGMASRLEPQLAA